MCGDLCGNSWHVSAIQVPRPPGGTQEREFHSWVWEESIEDIPNLPAGTKQYERELEVAGQIPPPSVVHQALRHPRLMSLRCGRQDPGPNIRR